MKSSWKYRLFFPHVYWEWETLIEWNFQTCFYGSYIIFKTSSNVYNPLRDWIVQLTMIYVQRNRYIWMWLDCIFNKDQSPISLDYNRHHLFIIWFVLIFLKTRTVMRLIKLIFRLKNYIWINKKWSRFSENRSRLTKVKCLDRVNASEY